MDAVSERYPIYIVDDDQNLLKMVITALKAYGFSVQGTHRPKEALEYIQHHHPAVVVLDLMMPDLGGYQILDAIRSQPELEDILVIILTAQGDVASRIEGLERGADDYLSKPFDIRELQARIRSLLRLRRVQDHWREAYEQVRSLVYIDELTSLYNRRFFEEHLVVEFARARRHGLYLSLVLMDLDNFKQINDTYGHPAGDEVLRTVGRILRHHSRREDFPCRYGGDEFTIILPLTPKRGAILYAERIQATLQAAPLRYQGEEIPLLASLGISTYPTDAEALHTAQLLHLADQRLYRAKAKGKGTLVFEE